MMDLLESGAKKLGIELSGEQLEQFETYYREMVEWNKKVNLTAITDHEEVQTKHFLDSLTIVKAVNPDNKRVIDIGTGAGLPGIPLKIAFHGICLTLLEATAKKVKFLEYIVGKLGLGGVKIATGRAEELGHDANYREKFDIALSRAVAEMPSLAELALPFCKVGGCFIAQKKGDIAGETERALRAIETMGGKLREVKTAEVAGLEEERLLVIIDKVKPTPPQYPRRPGMPVKRPLLS